MDVAKDGKACERENMRASLSVEMALLKLVVKERLSVSILDSPHLNDLMDGAFFFLCFVLRLIIKKCFLCSLFNDLISDIL